MKIYGKLVFINDILETIEFENKRLSDLKSLEFLKRRTDEIFSEETMITIGSMAKSSSLEMKVGFKNKTVADAVVTKINDSYTDIVIVYIKDEVFDLFTLEKEERSSCFYDMIISVTKEILFMLSQIKNSRNALKIEEIANRLFGFICNMYEVSHYLTEDNVKNGKNDETYVNISKFIDSMRMRILEEENVEVSNKIYPVFYSYVSEDALRNLIIRTVRHYNMKGQRAYVNYYINEDGATIEISNFKDTEDKVVCENKKSFTEDGESLIDIVSYASQNKINISRKTYDKGLSKIGFTLEAVKITRVMND